MDRKCWIRPPGIRGTKLRLSCRNKTVASRTANFDWIALSANKDLQNMYSVLI